MTCASLCPFKRDQLREGAATLGAFQAKPTRASSSRPSPVSEFHFSRQIIMLQQLKLESSFVYNARIQLGEIFLFETWGDSQKWIEKFSKLSREIVNILTAAWPDGEWNLADRFCVTSFGGGGGCDRCNSISNLFNRFLWEDSRAWNNPTNPSGYDQSITRSTKTCTLRLTSQPSTWRSSTEKITRTNRIYVHNWIFVLSHFDFPAQKRAAHLIRNCNFLLPPSIIVFTSRFICSDFGTGKFYGPLHNPIPIDSNFMAR